MFGLPEYIENHIIYILKNRQYLTNFLLIFFYLELFQLKFIQNNQNKQTQKIFQIHLS